MKGICLRKISGLVVPKFNYCLKKGQNLKLLKKNLELLKTNSIKTHKKNFLVHSINNESFIKSLQDFYKENSVFEEFIEVENQSLLLFEDFLLGR